RQAMTIANFSMSPSTRLVFGVDRVEKLGADVAGIAGEGASVLLVADPGLPKIAERIGGILRKAGHKVGLFSDVRSDPLGAQVDAAAAEARAIAASCVVGVGGGSTMDVSKFAAAIARSDRPADHYELAKNPLPKNGLKKICIPT